MITFRQIRAVETGEFSQALAIYEEAFPPNEKQSLRVISSRISEGLEELFVGETGGAIVFMALLWPLKGTPFTLLDYMATRSTDRGMNIGSQFLIHLGGRFASTGRFLLIESEHPDFGDNREMRARRVAFYRRNGARQLQGIRYLLPALDGTYPTEMILMLMPSPGRLSANLIRNMISVVYREVYDTDPAALLKANEETLNGELLSLE